MRQYNLEKGKLTLYVKAAQFGVVAALYILAFIGFLAPLTSLVFSLMAGASIGFGIIISFIIFGLVGFFLLRMALWNSFGKEHLEINANMISYVADYGWFTDGQKTIRSKIFTLSTQQVGYANDKTGVLVIKHESGEFNCVAKLPLVQLDEIITQLAIQ